MKRFFYFLVFFIYSFSGFAQTRVGIDLFRFAAKTIDIGATYQFKKNFFLSARTGYTFDRAVPERYGVSNLKGSTVSGSFIAAGIGVDMPRAKDTSFYVGFEFMADWGSREDNFFFQGIYGEQILTFNQNFRTVGMNFYLGKRNKVWRDLYFDTIIRCNFIQCDPGQFDRVASPSIGVDWNGSDGSFALNLNAVFKVIYQFGGTSHDK